MLGLLSPKAQENILFEKTSIPCHVGIHWKAFAEYSQMSTNLPGFRSFSRIFSSVCIDKSSQHEYNAACLYWSTGKLIKTVKGRANLGKSCLFLVSISGTWGMISHIVHMVHYGICRYVCTLQCVFLFSFLIVLYVLARRVHKIQK